jgi:octaprenyl-diphosphate synthase
MQLDPEDAAMPLTQLESIIGFLQDDLDQVERLLREGTRSVAPLIPEVGEHTFGSGGKRVRPVLVLLSARLCGYRGPRAVQIASAVECLHTATLMHDDVVDGAETRRGRASVNALWGQRIAVLVGDFMFARASQTLIEDGDSEILWIYANTIREMSEGEVLQLTRSFDPDVPESVYLDVIGRKTSRLLSTTTESGAILGGVTRAERRAVGDYGWQLGLAFQLVDDALDYVGDGDELGKAPLADLAEGKVTMPLIATLKRCSVAEREAIVAALKSLSGSAFRGAEPDRDALMQVADQVRRYQGAELTLERARLHAREACAKIAPFSDCEAKRALNALAEFVVRRKT